MGETSTRTFDVKTLFAGGRLCLDFVNTLCQVRDVELELLGSAGELKRWLRSAEAVTEQRLLGDDEEWELDGGGMLARAIELRAAIHSAVESILLDQPAPVAAIEKLNSVLRANPAYPQIEYGQDGFKEAISFNHPGDRWLTLIAQDAVDLLCRSDLSQMRQCECPTCIRFFLDTTKNHKRRWCVEKCGSAPKAAAYYRRKKAKVQGDSV